MTPSALPFRRFVRGTLPALVLLAGLSLFPAKAAHAGGLPSPHELHHEVRDTVSSLFRALSRVPVSLHLHNRDFEVFLGGYEYYRPHGHNHAVYRFPVWVDDDVHYRPYSYCNGRLFGHDHRRPRLWVEWGSPRAGHWCDRCNGYFPARHGHFHSRYDRHRYDGYRHDRYRHDRYRHDRYRHDRYRHDRHRHDHYRHDRHRGHHRDRHWNHRRDHRRHHDGWRHRDRDRDRGHRDHHARDRDRDRGHRDHHARGDRDRGRRDHQVRDERHDGRDGRDRGDHRGRGQRRQQRGGG